MRAAVLGLAALLVLTGCSGGADPTPPGEVIPVADRDPAPPVAGDLLGGGTFDPARTDGVVTVVNFWGSWCPPCRLEVPELQDLADRNPDVLVVGVALRDSPELAEQFRVHQGISYPSIDDPGGELATAFRAWPLTSTPSTVVLDDRGRVAAAYPGPVSAEDLQRAVDQLA
ncbi:TlpA family protein disulfide reductase [Klenkia brasiliensis]|uniref:Peroxiredoxin n=1 Tax=Klenkia brasiliensis TaxID=333142 RepID=A0A1G7YWE2_9ACTN|nr:TlpA disulfide reductase family protein [Klenkia brasiliensis]SDH00707.1 Peroxiredoxin [Klenkia brasiliensis]